MVNNELILKNSLDAGAYFTACTSQLRYGEKQDMSDKNSPSRTPPAGVIKANIQYMTAIREEGLTSGVRAARLITSASAEVIERLMAMEFSDIFDICQKLPVLLSTQRKIPWNLILDHPEEAVDLIIMRELP